MYQKIVIASVPLLPLLALAQSKTPQSINDIFVGFSEGNIAGYFPSLILVALVTFLAGIIKFMTAGDDEEARAQGRQVMIYGIIVLFVMIATWSLVGIVTQTFLGEDPKIPNYLPKLL